jgi:hypothetical protein
MLGLAHGAVEQIVLGYGRKPGGTGAGPAAKKAMMFNISGINGA